MLSIAKGGVEYILAVVKWNKNFVYLLTKSIAKAETSNILTLNAVDMV